METIIFDKAKYHFNGKFPNDLDAYQGYVHTGFFIGWLILKNFMSDNFKEDHKDAIAAFVNLETTCVKVYMDCLDGVFSSEDVNAEGLEFTNAYFDLDKGRYLSDYAVILTKGLPSLYHVEDSIDNFTKILPIIELRYNAWKHDPETLSTIELR